MEIKFICCVFLVMLVAAPSITGATVHLSSPNITYGEGQTAYLRCSVTGVSNPSFKWYHWGYPRYPQYHVFSGGSKRYTSAHFYWDRYNVRESSSDGYSVLSITDLQMYNAGIYTCLVGNQHADITLKVERNSNMTLTVPSRVPANQPITVRCSTMAAIPVETLSWYLDGARVNKDVTSQSYITRFKKDYCIDCALTPDKLFRFPGKRNLENFQIPIMHLEKFSKVLPIRSTGHM
ncbi:uncharacterized protein [Diadema setosum]|uniref:uncharacterized protein n=1 Tax=Diadema setosum TaxID=31175 RepID=UPI003B3A8C00